MKIPVSRSRIAFSILILLVFAATGFFVVNRYAIGERLGRPSEQTLQLELPESPWEPAFFKALEKRTTAVNLQNLRMAVLPEDDVEVRFWYDHFEIISGVIIRRTGQQWSANWIYQTEDHLPFSAKLVSLDPPKSGWDALWKNLIDIGILTIPDNRSAQCTTEALDGVSYVVETNVNRKYRTYMYSNPQLMKCSDAKQIVRLEETLRNEFGLP